MLSKEDKLNHYKQARKLTGCSQNDWARLFTLSPITGVKHRQRGQNNVQLKEAGHRGVNQAEVLAAELLLALDEMGIEVSQIDFDSKGKIISLPQKQKS